MADLKTVLAYESGVLDGQLKLLQRLERWVRKNGWYCWLRGNDVYMDVPSEELLTWISKQKDKLKESK